MEKGSVEKKLGDLKIEKKVFNRMVKKD